MPPIHPAIVHYPIALVMLSVIADLIGYIRGSESLQMVGCWALIGAIGVPCLRSRQPTPGCCATFIFWSNPDTRPA